MFSFLWRIDNQAEDEWSPANMEKFRNFIEAIRWGIIDEIDKFLDDAFIYNNAGAFEGSALLSLFSGIVSTRSPAFEQIALRLLQIPNVRQHANVLQLLNAIIYGSDRVAQSLLEIPNVRDSAIFWDNRPLLCSLGSSNFLIASMLLEIPAVRECLQTTNPGCFLIDFKVMLRRLYQRALIDDTNPAEVQFRSLLNDEIQVFTIYHEISMRHQFEREQFSDEEWNILQFASVNSSLLSILFASLDTSETAQFLETRAANSLAGCSSATLLEDSPHTSADGALLEPLSQRRRGLFSCFRCRSRREDISDNDSSFNLLPNGKRPRPE